MMSKTCRYKIIVPNKNNQLKLQNRDTEEKISPFHNTAAKPTTQLSLVEL